MAKLLILALALCAIAVASVCGKRPITLGNAIQANRFNGFDEVSDISYVDFSWGNITQRVDNFNAQNTDTFEQRFVSAGEFYQPGGPIVIIVGGTDYISGYELNSFLSTQIANVTDGYLFSVEHRFVGQSYPNTDFSTESLRFMTPDQALADLAHFIAHIKSSEVIPGGAPNAPVILTGRGYGGSLAVWFRQKYPHLAQGAWASGAPVLAKLDHFEYKDLAGQTFREMAGDECYNVLDAGFAQLTELADANEWAELGRLFNVCDNQPLQSENDVSMLFLTLSEYYTSFSTFRPYVPYMCGVFSNDTHATPLDAILAFYRDFESDNCQSYSYEEHVAFFSSHFAERVGYRQEMYLQCTQLGWFRTSGSRDQPFGSHFPVAFFTNLCTDIFGERVNAAALAASVDRVNVEHGGLRPLVTKVLFTYGAQDSSRSLSVLENFNDSVVTIVEVPESGASYEFYASSLYESDELAQIKHRIVQIAASWA